MGLNTEPDTRRPGQANLNRDSRRLACSPTVIMRRKLGRHDTDQPEREVDGTESSRLIIVSSARRHLLRSPELSYGEAERAIGWFKRAIVPRPDSDMTYQIARGRKSLTWAPHETHSNGRSLRLRAPLPR